MIYAVSSQLYRSFLKASGGSGNQSFYGRKDAIFDMKGQNTGIHDDGLTPGLILKRILVVNVIARKLKVIIGLPHSILLL